MKTPPPITNKVKAFREAHGDMSQGALAKAIGVSRQTIIAIEQGHYSPSLERAFRISRIFGVGIEDVFGWGDDGSNAAQQGGEP